MTRRKVDDFRVSLDPDGVDELVIHGLVHVEQQALGLYVVVLGFGPDSRRFTVSRRGKNVTVIDQDGF